MAKYSSMATIKANEIEVLNVSLQTVSKPAMHVYISTVDSYTDVSNGGRYRYMEYGYSFAPTQILKLIKFFNETYRFDDIDKFKIDPTKHNRLAVHPNTYVRMLDYNDCVFTLDDINMSVYKEGDFMRICAERESVVGESYQMLDVQLSEYYIKYLYKQLKDAHYL